MGFGAGVYGSMAGVALVSAWLGGRGVVKRLAFLRSVEASFGLPGGRAYLTTHVFLNPMQEMVYSSGTSNCRCEAAIGANRRNRRAIACVARVLSAPRRVRGRASAGGRRMAPQKSGSIFGPHARLTTHFTGAVACHRSHQLSNSKRSIAHSVVRSLR